MASQNQERTGKSAERKDAPIQEIETREKKKSWSLGTQKLGNYAKNLLKGFKDTIQNQIFVEPLVSNNTTQDTIQHQKNEKQTYSEEDDEEEEEEEFDEDEEQEEGDEEEEEESEESEGYEEDEGSLEDEQEEEANAAAKGNKKEEVMKRASIDNFAIDDDESPPIQHPGSGSLEDAVEETKHKEEEKPKKKKARKGKGKKGKSKKSGGAKPKQQSDNLTFEDVYVNKTFSYGGLFTEFHQFYFKGDYLDFEPDEFFRAVFVNEKTAISNLLFNERRYLNVQDNVFYVTKLETVENYKLALVLESFPLSRMVRLERNDKKKRIDIAFYTEDGGQNVQRELVFEVKNYQKFLKILNQSLSSTNSSVHILSFNIE